MFVFTVSRDVYQVGIHVKKMRIDYSMNGRKIRATFCFRSKSLLCRPMSGVFQRPSGQWGDPWMSGCDSGREFHLNKLSPEIGEVSDCDWNLLGGRHEWS